MTTKTTRRGFLTRAVGAAAAPLIFPRVSLAAPPSSRLQHAAIGVLGQGRSDLEEINGSGKVDVVALCDIDENSLEEAAATYPKARLYRDWREMLDKEEKTIDSVNIAIPDHMHAPAAMTAIRMGKHVYCEKPLTHQLYEARKLTLAARKKKVATQMGIQIHAHDFYRTAVIWLQQGAIGKVKEWHSWCSASYSVPDGKRPEGADPVPSNVDWDLWLGVAPKRLYKTDVYHPFKWRCWRDFGSGATGDFGCHIFDPVFTALNIGAPLSVSAQSEMVSEEAWPAWAVLAYEFTGSPMTTGKMINATWHDGGKQPDSKLSPHLPSNYELPKSGSLLIGEDGSMIIPHVGHPELYPAEKFKNYTEPKLEPLNHYHDFVEAALGTRVAGANFDFAGPMTEAVLLGNVANRYPGKTLEWNAARMRFTNSDDANKHLRWEYREGWEVRGL
ncbi:MAG: Gfo/Idh/MocA family oxidoreductase [Candidatus Hydrogenedentota bacterium]